VEWNSKSNAELEKSHAETASYQVATRIAAQGSEGRLSTDSDSAILDLIQSNVQERIGMPPRKASPWLQ
jgi:hypothetical protein